MEAVDRFKKEAGAAQNAYSWYRQHAATYGLVWISDDRIPAVKQGRQWMVDKDEFETALTKHQEKHGHILQMNTDYYSRILHPGTVKLRDGGYTKRGDFHYRWSDIARARMKGSGTWYCNTCWAPAANENNREECHRCRDWGSCGRDCTLSEIHCPTCGTSAKM